ncbi:hypothetical protein WAK64_10180 [Bacillus spongiae]|uniref:Uncharacterized protein n=1 Tax=Bacillus spongiae TaxID=2683610 RepID=A0ABU8HE17_9BACI
MDRKNTRVKDLYKRRSRTSSGSSVLIRTICRGHDRLYLAARKACNDEGQPYFKSNKELQAMSKKARAMADKEPHHSFTFFNEPTSCEI